MKEMKCVITLLICLLCGCSKGGAQQGTYTPTTVQKVHSQGTERVTLTGYVALVVKDGNQIYVRVCDDPSFTGKGMDFSHCVVNQLLPGTNFFGRPGDKVTLRGATKFQWWQVRN